MKETIACGSCRRHAEYVSCTPKADLFRCAKGHLTHRDRPFSAIYDVHHPPPEVERPGVNPELLRRDRILSILAATRKMLLERLRAEMKALYLSNGGEPVTADDARKLLDSWPDIPPPEELNRNFMGALFRNGDWLPVDVNHQSRTKGSNARRIVRWQLKAGR